MVSGNATDPEGATNSLLFHPLELSRSQIELPRKGTKRARGGGGEADTGPSAMQVDGEEEGGGEEVGPSSGAAASGVDGDQAADSELASLDFSRLTQEHRNAQDAAAKEAIEK